MTNLSARTQAALLLLLVGLVGALVGIVGDRLVSGRSPATAEAREQRWRGPAPNVGPWRWEPRPDARYAERLARSLDLTAEQKAAIERIVAEEQTRVRELTREVQPRFRTIAADTRQRIDEVLTEQQRERLRELREQRVRGIGSRMGERPPRR